MKKTAIVYWSGTGNTAAMADAVLTGALEAGSEATLMTSAEFNASMLDRFDAIAFGCPAMGAEVLEESEFEPMFSECKAKLSGKPIALFGSYGWGDGEWMRQWESDCGGAKSVCDSVICADFPDEVAIDACKKLGAALAQ